MKKLTLLIIAFICFLTIVGCNTSDSHIQTTESISTTATENHTTSNEERPTSTNNDVDTIATENTDSVTDNNIEPDITTDEITDADDVTTYEKPNTTAESEHETEEDIEKVDFSAYLATLLKNYKASPTDAIPESLSIGYQPNLINPNNFITDYSSSVNVASMPSGGFGEQWNMILDNLNQTNTFFDCLYVVDTIASSSIVAFNNYIDKNPSDTAHYKFAEGIYSVTINCDKTKVDYVLDYTANIPVLGEQTVQIALSLDLESEIKSVRIQLGDPNALAYTIDGNHYTFALKYLGIRRAYFEIQSDTNGNTSGHIYEYLTLEGAELASVADFYVSDDYVTVVGNKADGIIGFKNYICELYSVSTGKLVGYEIRESSPVSALDITFDTVWVELKDVSGINSIKYINSGDDKAGFYVNGSTSKWQNTKVSLIDFSRRFDIEFKVQYYYYYDSTNGEYKAIKATVPMLFVQEKCLETLSNDIKSANKISTSLIVKSADMEMLLTEYDCKIDLLIANKGKYSVNYIISFIGDPKTFN